MLNLLVTCFCIQNSLDAISIWKNVEQDISTRHYTFLNSSYDFLAQKYQIPKNNYLMLSFFAWILLSISKHFLNTFIPILCHKRVWYSRGMQSNGHQLFFYWSPLNLVFFTVPHRKPIIIVITIIFLNILHISCVCDQLGTCWRKQESLVIALLHISWVLKWSRTSSNKYG